jgi:HK97 family phage portal protein
MVLTPGQAVWSNRDYAAFASEGYRKNVVAYQAINKIADAVASVPWNVFRGETELTAHPLTDLLTRPNPMQSGAQYMRAKVGFFLLAGNGYEERVTVGGNVRELYQLRPDRMQIIPGINGFPIAYQYKASGRTIRWDVEPGTFDCDVRHLKSFNPLDDWYGLSAIEAGAFAVDQNNQAMEWMQALLQNSARPSGALSSPQDKDLTGEQFNRLKAQIEDQYSGARNAGRPMLLEGGLKWEQMGLSPVDMQIIETKFSSARDVALALGVPPQLLGIPGDNTYSNYAEARLAFWEDTVIPLLDVIADDWNYWLAEPMGVQLRPDLDQIPAIADKRRILWDMADKATDLTLNERRAMKGYEPVAGGDEILVASSQISLGMAVNPPDLPQDLTAADIKAFAYGVKY